MGLFDVLRGKRAIKKPAPTDRVFAMTTAQVTLEMELGLKTTGKAAIVFQPLATADFEQIVRDMEEVVRSSGEDTGTTIETRKSRNTLGLSSSSEDPPPKKNPNWTM